MTWSKGCQLRAVADLHDQHVAVIHLHDRLQDLAAVEQLRRPGRQTGQTRGDRGQLVRPLGQADAHWQRSAARRPTPEPRARLRGCHARISRPASPADSPAANLAPKLIRHRVLELCCAVRTCRVHTPEMITHRGADRIRIASIRLIVGTRHSEFHCWATIPVAHRPSARPGHQSGTRSPHGSPMIGMRFHRHVLGLGRGLQPLSHTDFQSWGVASCSSLLRVDQPVIHQASW